MLKKGSHKHRSISKQLQEGQTKLSTNRKRKEKKGHGYRPKSAGGGSSSSQASNGLNTFLHSKNRNLILLIVASVITIAGIAIYNFGFNSKSNTKPDTSGMITTSTGLKYQDVVVGTGATPKLGDQVSVHYTGTFEDGTKFDSSIDRGEPIIFPIGVGQVVKGWDEGIMTMKVGGKRKLVIPPNLGYGAQARGQIPPNSTMYFDVELLDVK